MQILSNINSQLYSPHNMVAQAKNSNKYGKWNVILYMH